VQSVPEAGGPFALPENEAKHVFKVLRAREGDLVEVVGVGRLFLARIGAGKTITVAEELDPGFAEVGVSLYQAVPKGGRMDLVVEKATEAGATRIVPLLTRHGEVSPREGKVERWRRVAEAAARQSLRLGVPEVAEPMSFWSAIHQAGEPGVLLHNVPDVEDVEDAVGSEAHLFVGPEGGWSEEEVEAAREAGFDVAGLGPHRLRSETAGIVAVARARAALERRIRVEGGV
jgi:16S rRNA (uracil1498-N3)-methyltransferase